MMTENYLLDIEGMKLQVLGKNLCRFPAWNIGIMLDKFDQTKEAVVCGVVLKHIHDETFLDGLSHGVFMKG